MANMLGGIDSSDPNETDVTYTYNGMLQRGWRSENGPTFFLRRKKLAKKDLDDV
jgi:hypothetical protein